MTDNGPTEPIGPTAAAGDGSDPAEQPGAAPWYRRPVTWIIAAVLLIALALGLVLAFSGGDSEADYATVTVDRVDDAGDPLQTEMLGSIRATTDPEAYRWVTPSDASAPGDAVAAANSSGTVTFRWGPTSEVDDPTEWASSLSMTEALAPNTTLVADSFDCTLRRGDEPDALVVLTIALETPADPEQPSVATYSFQNFEFLPADIMTCGVANGEPGATTTTTTSTTPTTVPETTAPETTAPETTAPETTAPETTVPATTAPATTVPATTAPPTTAPATSLMGVIESRSDLSTLVDLIDVAGLRDTLSNPGTITLFAPDDAAFDDLVDAPDAPDVNDPATVQALLLAHTNLGEVLLAADVFALTEVPVENGGPQPVDPDAGTVGGAEIAEADLTADNGVVHVLRSVLDIQP